MPEPSLHRVAPTPTTEVRSRPPSGPLLSELFEDPFSRAAGAPRIRGNAVRLLKDASENYPAWLDAIRAAERHIHFETYFISDDDVGREFAAALAAKARDGVAVRLIYDWFGNLGKASRRFWRRLVEAGVEVRCYNPPRFDSPLGWLYRDHRKVLSVDARVGFVSGLCVAGPWAGDPVRGLEPWRDTGVEIRGRAVHEIERNFARIWDLLGGTVPTAQAEPPAEAGDVNVRIVATEPSTAGVLRVDQLVAALATSRLWLTDAYYAGVTTYVQALRAAAQDGIDVRLLVPNATDLPLLRPISRYGYRPLLEAGVRVFEWNGRMLHAKSAVADGEWSRVGSTNLNVASWLGNCELDAIVENARFAQEMERMYLEDLEYSTEVVLQRRRRRGAGPGRLRTAAVGKGEDAPRRHMRAVGGRGSATRAAAGALRIGRAVGAAFVDRRVLGPVEARLAAVAGCALLLLAVLVALFPRVLAYPLGAFAAWAGLSFLLRGLRLWRERERAGADDRARAGSAETAGTRKG